MQQADKVHIYAYICSRGHQSIRQHEVDRAAFEKALELFATYPNSWDMTEAQADELDKLTDDTGIFDLYHSLACYVDRAPFLAQWKEHQKLYAAGEEVVVGCGLSEIDSKLAYVDGQRDEILNPQR